MVKLFKNKVDITGVAVLLMAFFVAVGFKAADSMETTKWYQVTLDDPSSPNDPENQEIGAELSGTPTTPCVSPLTTDTICAIQLRLGDGINVPATVQDAMDAQASDPDEVFIQSRRHIDPDEN